MFDLQMLTEILSRFVDNPILVVGDLMIDEYIWGHVNRISPEAPVQIVEVEKEESTLGGAGNVVKNLASLKAHVFVCSVVDESDTGELIVNELNRLGVETSGIFKNPEKVSSSKTRILSLDTNQQILRVDRESLQPISQNDEKKITDYINSHIEKLGAIILSDYLKGVLTQTLTKKIIARAREKNIPVIVDPKGKNYEKYRNATVITPNKKEAEAVFNLQTGDDQTLFKAGRHFLNRLKTEAILVTLGKDGMALFQKGRKVIQISAVRKEVYDVTGAGDTVISLLGLGMASGLDLRDSIEIANIAAGIVVSKIGTATVTQQEIIDHVLQHTAYSGNKVLDRASLTNLVEDRKKSGNTIVFTNGCFDILHMGHTSFLQQARQLGDLLIVGLNSDDSVRRLKGSHRPVVPMRERAAILSSLAGVDYITVFDEDTPLNLIRTLKPHILVKGDDYGKDEVVGREIVESYGGRVELIKLVKGVSTTAIIDRMAQTSDKKHNKKK
jgi:D-beta-D-heptose 7-phosphate kinase/D-beta-D-heptose 1-phosphate adenosyltransferase